MDQPIVSLCATAVRTQNWLYLHSNAGINSSIPFEMVFVGPKEPDFILPDNFKYIKTDVKPVQCYEIGARNTSGELILYMMDDCIFMTPDPLGKLYEQYVSYNLPKLMLSCRFMTDGVDASYECHRFSIKDPNSPIMPIGGLISRDIYMELGGADRNFVAVYWDLDLALRLYSIGGRVLLSEDVYINEVRALCGNISTASEPYGKYDKKLLQDLWVGLDGLHFNRLQSFEPFLDEGILEESQGLKGRW
jgi:hypothetical protein